MKWLEKNVNPIGLSVTDRKYNCEKHAFKRIRYTSYCRTMKNGIERKSRKTLIPLVSLSKYASAIYHCVALTVRRNRDKALWFCVANSTYIFRGSIVKFDRGLRETKRKIKYRVFRSIKYTYCVCVCCVCVCVCARARVFVYVCVSYIVYEWLNEAASVLLLFFFF